MVVCFTILGIFGYEIYLQKPPVPEKVVTVSGQQLFSAAEIMDGQSVWQSIGGQENGTIWGHGSYVAPDWSADWLHREAEFMLNEMAINLDSTPFSNETPERRSYLKSLLQKELRSNTYDEKTGTLTISDLRAKAIAANMKYYSNLFTNGKELDNVRKAYAIPENTIKDEAGMHKMNAFFFWTSWSCVTQRPGKDITYTNNWPPDDLVGNHPNGKHIFWSLFSIILLLLGIGLLGLYYAKNQDNEPDHSYYPEQDPLLNLIPTPSMKATLKYFWIVTGLILLQVGAGVITAHYGVEGNGFYGLNLDRILPYSVSRTWHVQLAIFWIATAWLATGLYIAPAVSGVEPKFQKAGVNILFGALLIVVLGSMAGEWMGIMQKLGLVQNFYFGHQGYEYVDLGRFWQILLFAGLVIWLFLMIRALMPAMRVKSESKQTIAAVDNGIWYARSMEFMQSPGMQTLRWLRIFGDTIFTLGSVGLVYFVIGLSTGWSIKKNGR